jgi:WD40 repeat protein/serine/threonine protein kinase
MKPADEREEVLFREALKRASGPERKGFLDGVCRGDDALRARLEALLQAHESPEPSLEPQAAPAAASTVLLPPEEGPGALIGRYKVLEKIGEGGFGVVYVAEQREPVKRRVALKIIKLGMDTRQVVARFEAERQALALMDHPNIAKVLDAGATESPHPQPLSHPMGEGGRRPGEGVQYLPAGRPFFVMELVKGIPITKYCDQEKLATRERLDLFIQVCHAIQHAHQKGIIHRDIKPSNILVTLHDGVPVPKVIDFGIAKATQAELTEKTVYTQFQQFIGTPAYMSPEQAEMSGLDIDTRSDIYSLGVLLYELLTGSTPFDTQELLKSGLDEMRKIIREREPMRPSTRLSQTRAAQPGQLVTRHSSLATDLDWIVMKCLEKDRTRRYETANGVALDIERHLKHEPVTARPPSAAYKFQKAFRRNKLALTAAMVVAAALVAGIGVGTWQAVEARRAQRDAEGARNSEQQQRLQAQSAQKAAESERQRAETERERAQKERRRAEAYLYDADMNLAQRALKENNLREARRLVDRHRPQPGQEDLRGWEWRYLWQLTRGNALVTLTNRPVRGWSVSFSPDGRRLAVGWWDGCVDVWDVPGRRWIRRLTEGKDLPQAQVAFSPIRNLLAATSQPKTVTLYDLDSGRESILWRGPEEGNWVVRNLEFSQDGSKGVIHAGSMPQDVGGALWVVNVSSAKIESRLSTASFMAYHFGAATLSPDNQRLYVGRSDGGDSRYSIQCLDVATGREVWQTDSQRGGSVTAMAISPDGRVLASGWGFEDPDIRVCDAATGRLLVRLEGHTSWVCKLVFTKDGHRLMSAATDQTLRIWDAATWTEAKVLRGHKDEVHAVDVSGTAHLLASASKDGDLMLWSDEPEKAEDGYLRLPEDLQSIDQVMPLDGSRVMLFHDDRPHELFDLSRGASLGPLLGLGSSSDLWAFSAGWLCRWDGTNQILVEKWSGSRFTGLGAVTLDSGMVPIRLAFNPARQLVAWNTPAASNSVSLTSLTTPGRRIELKSEIAGVSPFLFSDDGKYLAAAAPGWAALRVWNVDAGQSVVTLGEPIYDQTFAAGGRVLVALVAVSGRDNEIRFYDLDHPDRPPRRVPGKHLPAKLAVSPDGRLVVASAQGGPMRLCDAVTGELIEELHGYLLGARGLAFSADGRRLISAAGGRQTAKLWDVGTGQELLNLSGAGSLLWRAAWSADGDTILAGAPWQAWRAPPWEEIATAEAKEKTQ